MPSPDIASADSSPAGCDGSRDGSDASAPIVLAITTLPDREAALGLARGAVQAGLAACAQVDGTAIASVYRWQGRLCEDAEWRLVFKTAAARADALREWVARRHPYEVPQWVVVAAEATPEYAGWVVSSTHADPGDGSRHDGGLVPGGDPRG